MKKISIILVSYNTKQLLDECLASLIQNIGFDASQYEIIVIENASKDHSLEMVREKYPNVVLVENRINTGFAKGVNQGLKLAAGDSILLLNPDTRIPRNTIPAVQSFTETHSNIGVVGCKLKNNDDSLQNTFGKYPGIISEFFFATGLYRILPIGRIIRGSRHLKHPLPVDWVSGAFMMFQKKIIDTIGILDEKYYMYLEDIDFCYRAKKAGFKNYYIPSVFVWHHLSASSGDRRAFLPIWLDSRNTVHFVYKHSGFKKAKMVKSINLMRLWIQSFRFTLKRNYTIANAYKAAYQQLQKSSLQEIAKPYIPDHMKKS